MIMGFVKNEDICKIIDDLGLYVRLKEVIIVTALSLPFVLLLLFSGSLCIDEIKELLLTIIPSLLGFSIAAYTILFGLSDKLHIKSLSGEKVFEVVQASFIFGLITQGIALIIGLTAEVMSKCMDWAIATFICYFSLFFSIIWILNMVLHLYSLRTFIGNNNQK